MTKRFHVTGYFNNVDYSIDVNVGEIEAKDRTAAEYVVDGMNFGVLFYDSKSGNFFHSLKDDIRVLDDYNVNSCDLLQPRKDFKHEMFMGAPIYEKEDIREITFSELIKATAKESTERNKSVITFECISYGLREL